MRTIVVLAILLCALPAAAQQQVQVIEPGMSRAQVIERLGQPAAVRSTGDFTYLFFRNGCERECGMSDLVTLEHDGVIDAIFRASHRQFTGASTSPSRVPPGQRGSRVSTAANRGELRVPAAEPALREPAVIGEIRVERPVQEPPVVAAPPAEPVRADTGAARPSPAPDSARLDTRRAPAPPRAAGDTVTVRTDPPAPVLPASVEPGPQPR